MYRLHHLFNYTSGRWLYNEQRRLEGRVRPFNVSALQCLTVQAVSKNSEDIVQFQKLGEGASNRAFIVRMRDGPSLVARIPYMATVPRGFVVASEVATMEFLPSKGIPVPKVYGYSTSTNNPAGVEYILMEYGSGRILSEIWDDMNQQDRPKTLSNIIEVENRLFSIRLPASGSIYFSKDMPQGARGVPIDHLDAERPCSLHVGPDAITECGALLTAGARKEIEYLTKFGRPLLPFSRMRRETFSLERQDPGTHIDSLGRYLQIAEHLIPKDSQGLLQPVVRHPDLRPSNIFVFDDFSIASLIDWQHSTVQPLFLQAGIPSMFNNSHDAASRSWETLRLPSDLDDMSKEEKTEQLGIFRDRQLHCDYIAQTAQINATHFKALKYPYASFRRRLHRLSGDCWQGDNQEKYLRLDKLVREAEDEMHAINVMLGVGPAGWVPCDHFDATKAAVDQMKADCLERAEYEIDEAAVRDHWVFDDMDEDEYR
ncbi:hypothetical protein M409DRAFT_63333 [Zasmidium cellare ATCC 36951]|uniref:Aminoglycoside phosphotransferase domain-containing protein n=1 Tax=Zasmidium cellare ATCC 36951 TaxID=1080233 RepID=A0A6A6CWY4_ZASCE|nr:uncharacterized protein M409DRAFT_63333 [Zasmidium cellare ATCC 36951]KAF2171727.1 hypothetical protein M409DRAFT_63333 [Zasmidium cellare ATCC 36951]